MDYKSSGVNINAGNNFVDYVKTKVKQTFKPQVLGGIGGYASLFSLQGLNVDLNDAAIVSSTDGVGTKLAIAEQINKHDTIGIDLVAMCVNDLLCQGAKPLFFLDYIACGKIKEEIVNSILDGIIEGCKIGDMSLIGGETAEMPGLYQGSNYDLAGFAVGIVERKKMLPLVDIMQEGDILIGIHSSGIHSNGFSLVRKILEIDKINYNSECEINNSQSWGEFLLTPTKIYTKICHELSILVKGFAHITGGGITENLPRILPKNFIAKVNRECWKQPQIFTWLQEKGKIDIEEMYRVFNMGIGMIAVCSQENIEKVRNILNTSSTEFSEIGELITNKNEKTRVEYS